MYRIGIDVGGTFTDFVGVDEAGHCTFVKSQSTPEDPSIGVMTGLGTLAEALGLDRAALLRLPAPAQQHGHHDCSSHA